VSRSRAARASALAVVATVAVSGCSTHPGAAAVVGSESISNSRVDDVALALCAAQGSSGQAPGQDLAARAARSGALQVLVSAAMSQAYGRSAGLRADQAQVSAALSANSAAIDGLPSSRREVFRDTLRDYAEGQLVLIAAGRKQLVQRGTPRPTDDQALAAGTSVRDAWATKNLEVSVDPRFGRFTSGALQPRSGSLSAPVSTVAAAGAKAQPAPDWVSALPASQKCR
jgi:hypothetical protein